ncbi:hydrolase [Flavivirga eckloniae]|uniref:Hydrolase n=2 Tax=Flavivirga eckloniae TaxID=1803846 RepID=A0A2K9PXD7_9FLAO|nr:hydrolase [Flavivirga eckloniae]
MRIILSILFSIPCVCISQQGQIVSKKVYSSQRISKTEIPIIDGKLEDVIWGKKNDWASNFIQREPTENVSPSEETTFKIVYDAKHLYIGIKNFDKQPEKITNWMSRRDGFEGDWVEVIFDSYHDLRSAFSFTVTAAGVKGDKIITLNGKSEDITWNPIWYTKSAITNEGWTAEMKIPLSQLRFGKSENQVWGLQVIRNYFSNNETSVWQRIPIDAPGWISEFGELHGLNGLKPQRQFEIQPFVVTSLETFKKDPNNPYRDKHITTINAGIDGKIGITNDLTLDFTINPDFGQVEADPAAIALDGFQLFFREQRPFFVENKNIFNYQFSNPIVGGSFSRDNLFYSRRIGRNPQGFVKTETDEFSDAPERTTILGAVKFSGKTKDGWSIGVMESMTTNEYAKIYNNGSEREQLIEPFTNYFVGRVQKDFNNRNTFFGGIVTSTIRNLDTNTDFLHKSATTAGIDFMHQWKNRTWYLGANMVMSHVEGSEKSILRTQLSIPHLFQRTDAGHVSIDPTKTSLTGTGGDIKFGKAGQGHLKFETGFTWRSPELELNDLGFMLEADDIQNYAGITYNSLKPFGAFRKGTLTYQHWFKWDFEGNLNYIDWDVEARGTFQNNWNATVGFFSQPHIYSKSLLQGGPRIYLPDQYGFWWALGTDTRKKLSFSLDGWTKTGNEDSYFLLDNGLKITYQPINQFSLSVSPRYNMIRHRLQYNETVDFSGLPRYIMSKLDRDTFSLAFRFNYTINPNLSIQYYAEPYISKGVYSNFGYMNHALAKSHNEQIAYYTDSQIFFDETNNNYAIDEASDDSVDYHFKDPDFSFAQFRSNLVVRYEYKPGSEIFLVWAQGITDNNRPTGGLFRSFDNQIFSAQPNNTFLIKATYRFF